MKSLQKAHDVLEYVVLRNGSNVTPTEAAEVLHINPATCTRIMGELLKRGYLEKISRKNGYVTGAMCAALNTRDNLFTRIAKAADQPLRELSKALARQVNISVMHRGRRIMLNFHFSDPLARPWSKFLMTDHWKTATGRLLLAYMDENESRKICAACGLEEYPAELFEKIRKDGSVCFKHDSLHILGHAVIVPGYPPSAFGFGVTEEQLDKALALSAATAAEIRAKLLPEATAY